LRVIPMSPNALPMLTPAQIRAARAMVGWSRDDLAKRSGVSAQALRDFEKADGGSDPRQGTVHKWQRALEGAGIVFVDEDEFTGPGVRIKKGWPKAKQR
jgi:ribosome-binding protein aMBF1 (putative translation factor)